MISLILLFAALTVTASFSDQSCFDECYGNTTNKENYTEHSNVSNLVMLSIKQAPLSMSQKAAKSLSDQSVKCLDRGGGEEKNSSKEGKQCKNGSNSSSSKETESSKELIEKKTTLRKRKSGEGEKRPPSFNQKTKKDEFLEMRCGKCFHQITEEEAINGNIICNRCRDSMHSKSRGFHNVRKVNERKTKGSEFQSRKRCLESHINRIRLLKENAVKTSQENLDQKDIQNITNDQAIYYGDGLIYSSDSDTTSGSGSSTSDSDSDSDSDIDEADSIIFIPVEGVNGKRSTYRPELVKKKSGEIIARKPRTNLYNRTGLKKEPHRLKCPYPKFLYSNNELFSNCSGVELVPFPNLKVADRDEEIKPYPCSSCFKMLDDREQFAHNFEHLEEFFSRFDSDGELFRSCPWCKKPTPLLTMGYHLRESHHELLFQASGKTPVIEAMELFCGIGGLSQGLERAGIKVVAGLDLDETCGLSYMMNSGGIFIHEDIYNVNGNDLVKYFSPGAIRVLVAGVPCTTFSTLSKAKYSSEEKYGTLNQFKRIIVELKPDIFILENVPNLASRSSTGFHQFIKDLCHEGYYLVQKVLLSSEYGVPQHRKRLIVMASYYGYIKHPEASNSLDEAPTLKDAIGYLPKIDVSMQHAYDPMHATAGLQDCISEAIRYSPVGYRSGHLKWPMKVRRQNIENPKDPKNLSWRMWRHNVYGRMEFGEPSHTITTNALHPGGGPYTHPDSTQHRGLSVRELMNIQGFPKNMILRYRSGTKKKQKHTFPICLAAKHVGNAVPPPLGEAIGISIIDHVRQLKLPLPQSHLFPVFCMRCKPFKIDPDKSSHIRDREKHFQPLSNIKPRQYTNFLEEKTGSPFSLQVDPSKLMKPKPRKYATAPKGHCILSKGQLIYSFDSSAFLPFGWKKITVPPEVPLRDIEDQSVQLQRSLNQSLVDIAQEENVHHHHSLKRKDTSSFDDGGRKSKKRRKAGTAGIKGYACPFIGCLNPDNPGEQYSTTSSYNWFDHLIAHGSKFPFQGKKYSKLIHLGEAVLAHEKLIKCNIGTCAAERAIFADFVKLGSHVIGEHYDELDTLSYNGIWKYNPKATPLKDLTSSAAGKAYQTRYGEGFSCPHHPMDLIKPTPESLGRHWFNKHMKLYYFCPAKTCVVEKIHFQTPHELYIHFRSHPLLNIEDFDFTPLEIIDND
ncbi:DNA cytosine methyltransferase [Endozoicomonadaceae bacterium StTr2]